MRHPCISNLHSTEFIPNDTFLGGEYPRIILLTGPNMGGKSTLLRQNCIAVIMAQVGCYVPAESFRLTATDRIFTRIGANDYIMRGESTFMVELTETSTILKHATAQSIVILDELGRGTATFDGYSIAFAVLNNIATKIRCRTLFSTHYHLLCDEFRGNPTVSLYYMLSDNNEKTKEVTFLYQMLQGSCPKSYGMNVAKMAGVPDSIVERAEQQASAFEKSSAIACVQKKIKERGENVSVEELEIFKVLYKLISDGKKINPQQYLEMKGLWEKLHSTSNFV